MSRSQAQTTTQGILGGVWPAVAGGACWMTAFLVIRPDPLGLEWAQVLLMQALHGSANALGFGLAGFLAWTLEGAQEVPSGSLTKFAP